MIQTHIYKIKQIWCQTFACAAPAFVCAAFIFNILINVSRGCRITHCPTVNLATICFEFVNQTDDL